MAHRQGQLPEVTPAGLRRAFFLDVRARYGRQPHLHVIERQNSSLDPFVKYALRAQDHAVIEAVRIPLEHPNRFVVCVSSQVGCGLSCAFCATGRLGLRRNLEPWEIIEQVRVVRAEIPKGGRVHGVVFQGMGEPLTNLDAVIRTIRVLSNPSLQSIDMRAITVSTAGVASALPRLFDALPNVRIGISIGSAISAKRERLIPLDRKQPLALTIDLLAEQAKRTRIAPMWAYTLLNGVNDTDDDIAAMQTLVARFMRRAEIAPRISLIRYNPIGDNDPFAPSDDTRVEAFRSTLGTLGIPVVRRYSGGSDIAAACGQLGMRLGTETLAPASQSLPAIP